MGGRPRVLLSEISSPNALHLPACFSQDLHMFLFFSSSQSLSLSRAHFSPTLRCSCLNSSTHKLTFSLPLNYNCSSFMVLLNTYRHVFSDLWSVVEYRKLQLQTENGLIAARSRHKKKGSVHKLYALL